VVLGQSASASGLLLIAFMGGATLGSMLAGRLLSRLDRYKRVPIAGLALGILVLAAFAIWPARFSVPEVAALLALGGLGMGAMYPTTTVIIQNAVLPHQLGTATGTLAFFRQLGGALVVAVFGAIVLSGIEAGSPGAVSFDTLSGIGKGDFASLFRLVFVAAALFQTGAFVAVLLLDEKPLRGPSHARPVADAPAVPVVAAQPVSPAGLPAHPVERRAAWRDGGADGGRDRLSERPNPRGATTASNGLNARDGAGDALGRVPHSRR
jgi:MFS family permease